MRPTRNTALSAIVTGSRVGAVGLTMMLLARALGPGGFGRLTYAITLAGVFAVIPDYGFSLQVVRDVVMAPSRWRVIWDPALRAKVVLSVIAVVALVTWFALKPLPEGSMAVVWTLTASALALSYGQLNSYVLRGVDRFDLDAKSAVVLNGLLIVGIVASIALGGGVLGAALAYLGARCCYWVVTGRFLQQIQSLSAGHERSANATWRMLVDGLPYGLHAALAVLYVSVDTLVLGAYYPASVVGVYQGGVRLIFASMFVPEVLTSGLFPTFAAAQARGQRNEAIRVGREMNRLMVLCGGVTVGVFLFVGPLIRSIIFGPSYGALDALLPWFGTIILLRFVGATYGAMVTASGGQTSRTIVGAFALGANLVGNLLVTPRAGVNGALAVSIGTHVLLLVAYAALSWHAVRDWLLDAGMICIGLALLAAGALQKLGNHNVGGLLGALILLGALGFGGRGLLPRVRRIVDSALGTAAQS